MLTETRLRRMLKQHPFWMFAPDQGLSESEVERMSRVGCVRRFEDGSITFKLSSKKKPGLYLLTSDVTTTWLKPALSHEWSYADMHLSVDEALAWFYGLDPGPIDSKVVDDGVWDLARGLDTTVARFALLVGLAGQAAKAGAFATYYGFTRISERPVSVRAVEAWIKKTPHKPLFDDGLLRSRWSTAATRRFEKARDTYFALKSAGGHFDPLDEHRESSDPLLAMLRGDGEQDPTSDRVARGLAT